MLIKTILQMSEPWGSMAGNLLQVIQLNWASDPDVSGAQGHTCIPSLI